MRSVSDLPTVGFTVTVVAILLLAGIGSGLVLASSGYDLGIPGAIDTPEQTVTIDGDEYDVDAIASLRAGEALDVDVTVQNDESFRVDLYNTDREVEDFERGSGSERVTFETNDLEPGSYVLALSVDSNHVEIHPVVIEAYDVTLSADEEIDTDEDLEMIVEVTKIDADNPPAGVEVAVWNGESVIREDATDEGDGTYKTSISGAELGDGTYEIYAVAQGSDTIDGEPEILGVSDQEQITVGKSDDEDDSGAGGGGAPGGDDDPDDSENDSGDETNDPDNESDIEDSDTESDESEKEEDKTEDKEEYKSESEKEEDKSEDEEEGKSESEKLEDESDEDTESVIEPNEEDESPTEEERNDDIPLYAPTVILGVLLTVGIAIRVLRE